MIDNTLNNNATADFDYNKELVELRQRVIDAQEKPVEKRGKWDRTNYVPSQKELSNRFQKGQPRPPRKPKLTSQKAKTVVQESIALILAKQMPRVERILNKIKSDDPIKYLDFVIKLSEFVAPKVSRQEVTGEVQHTNLIIGKPANLQLPQPIDQNIIDVNHAVDNHNDHLVSVDEQ